MLAGANQLPQPGLSLDRCGAPGRPKGSTKAVVNFRRARLHSLAETEKRALGGDPSAQETLIQFAASKPKAFQPFFPSAA